MLDKLNIWWIFCAFPVCFVEFGAVWFRPLGGAHSPWMGGLRRPQRTRGGVLHLLNNKSNSEKNSFEISNFDLTCVRWFFNWQSFGDLKKSSKSMCSRKNCKMSGRRPGLLNFARFEKSCLFLEFMFSKLPKNQSAQNENMRSRAESRNFNEEEIILPTFDQIGRTQNYGDIFVATGNWTSHRNLDNFDSSVLVSTIIL